MAKRYGVGRPLVLTDIDLAVDSGTVVELAGANGVGKSTLLRILAGATRPTRGCRRIAPECALGYMSGRSTPPAMSARAYLDHHVRMKGLDPGAGDEHILELAEALQVRRLLGTPMAALSTGSLQKVAAIQCFLGRPDILILDEPFARLDVRARETLWAILAERARNGAAVVFCDHLEWPGREAHMRLALDDGRLTEEVVPGDRIAERSSDQHIRRAVPDDVSDQEIARLVDEGWHIISVSEQLPRAINIEAIRCDHDR